MCVPVQKLGLVYGLVFFSIAALALSIAGMAFPGWYTREVNVLGIKTTIHTGVFETCTKVKAGTTTEKCVKLKDQVLCKEYRDRVRSAGGIGIIFLFFVFVQAGSLLVAAFAGKATPQWYNFVALVLITGTGLITWGIMVNDFDRKYCGATMSPKAMKFDLGPSFAAFFVGWALAFFVAVGQILYTKKASEGAAAAPAQDAPKANEPAGV